MTSSSSSWTLARAGIHPPGEMPFAVAWSTIPSPGFERGFLQHHWRMRATWSATDWSLNLLTVLDGRTIGTQTVEAKDFAVHRTVATGSWIGREFQGLGFGKEMRAAVLGFAFDGLGARVAETSAFLDNMASNAVSRALGYAENGFGSLAPERHRTDDAELPDDRRAVAGSAPAAADDRGAGRLPRPVRGLSRPAGADRR